MASLTEVLSQLRIVRSLRFDATTEADTGWEGVGIGTVEVSEPAAGVIVFAEAGTWQSRVPGRAAIPFSNVFRWTVVESALRLEHLRFGTDNPVLLFDMAPGEDGTWQNISPHLCQEDCYTASLAVDGTRLRVEWSIIGPRKRESIRYTYFYHQLR